MKYYIFSILIYFSISPIQTEELYPIRISKKVGFINSSGNIIIDPTYDGVEFDPFTTSDLAYVYNNGKCGYINKKNIKVTDFIFFKCSKFEENYAIITDKFECINNSSIYRQSIINKKGQIIRSFEDREILSYSEGFFVYRLNRAKSCGSGYESQPGNQYGIYGLLDENGKDIPNIRSDYIHGFFNGISIVNNNRRWGVIDNNLNVIHPLEYDYISPFVSGYSTVRINDKDALINKKMEKIIEFGFFFSIDPFTDEYILACKINKLEAPNDGNCRSVIININGDILFEETKEIHNIHHFSEGVAGAANVKNKYGYIDKKFKWIIKPQYYSVTPFYKGIAKVFKSEIDYEKYRYIYIDKNGKIIWKHPDI